MKAEYKRVQHFYSYSRDSGECYVCGSKSPTYLSVTRSGSYLSATGLHVPYKEAYRFPVCAYCLSRLDIRVDPAEEVVAKPEFERTPELDREMWRDLAP